MTKISDFCKDRAAFYNGVVTRQSADDALLIQCKEMLKIDIDEIAELKAERDQLKRYSDRLVNDLRAEQAKHLETMRTVHRIRQALNDCTRKEFTDLEMQIQALIRKDPEEVFDAAMKKAGLNPVNIEGKE